MMPSNCVALLSPQHLPVSPILRFLRLFQHALKPFASALAQFGIRFLAQQFHQPALAIDAALASHQPTANIRSGRFFVCMACAAPNAMANATAASILLIERSFEIQ